MRRAVPVSRGRVVLSLVLSQIDTIVGTMRQIQLGAKLLF